MPREIFLAAFFIDAFFTIIDLILRSTHSGRLEECGISDLMVRDSASRFLTMRGTAMVSQ
jgi:hypothetical protein